VTVEVRLGAEHRDLEVADRGGEEAAATLRSLAPGLSLSGARRRPRLSFDDASALLDNPSVSWAPEAERAVRNRLEVRSRAAEVNAEARRLRTFRIDELREHLSDTALVDRLDEHQLRNVATMTIEGGWGACIFDEQGTGKTPTLIAAFDLLVERDEADTLLVVAPKSMIGEWAVEFERFCGELYRVAVVEGSRRERAAALGAGADVIVVNYEAAISLGEDLQLLARRSRTVLAVDESYNVKNPDAARTAALADLREWCGRCFVLCGTPAPNSPVDLVSQVDLVDFGLTFEDLVLSDDPEHDRDAVRSALEARGLYTRNLKRVVLPDLPGRRFIEVGIEFAPEQAALYEEALEGLIADLGEVDEETYRKEALSFMERRSALLRICSNPAGMFPGYSEVPGKISALDALLARQAEQDEKVVLWSFYRASLDFLAERYADYGIVRVDGSVAGVGVRREAVRSFQDDDQILVFLGNPAAAGAGLTLHRASLAIYESFSNQAAHFMQSLDRIHRRGQTREVEYRMLLCSGSIEEVEYERILEKMRNQGDLLGDHEHRGTGREELLEELLAARDRLPG
jgi:SNF2 family DNA or RNA helicase